MKNADQRPRIHMRPDSGAVAWAIGPIGHLEQRNLSPSFGDALNTAIEMHRIREAVVIIEVSD